jgi:hypothetical protein
MSAPTINAAAAPPSTGPASGIGAGPPAAQGPLAGFEALLAAFFGAQGELVTPGQPGKVAAAKSGVTIGDGSPAEGDTPGAKIPDDLAATDAAAATAAAACNAGLILPVVALPITAAPAAIAATTGEVGGDAANAPNGPNAAAAFGLGRAAAKSQAPSLPQIPGAEQPDAAAPRRAGRRRA